MQLLVLVAALAEEFDAAAVDVAALEGDLDQEVQAAPIDGAAPLPEAQVAPVATRDSSWQAPAQPLAARAALLARRTYGPLPRVQVPKPAAPKPAQPPAPAQPAAAPSGPAALLAAATNGGDGEQTLLAKAKLFEEAAASLTRENDGLSAQLVEEQRQHASDVQELKKELKMARAATDAFKNQVGKELGTGPAYALSGVGQLVKREHEQEVQVAELQAQLQAGKSQQRGLLDHAAASGMQQAAQAQGAELTGALQLAARARAAEQGAEAQLLAASSAAQAAQAQAKSSQTELAALRTKERDFNATVAALGEDLARTERSLAMSQHGEQALAAKLLNATDVAQTLSTEASAARAAAQQAGVDVSEAEEAARREALETVGGDVRASVEADLRMAQEKAQRAERALALAKRQLRAQGTELQQDRAQLAQVAQREAIMEPALVVAA